MDLGGTLINTFVVLTVGAILAYLNNDRFKILRRDIEGVKEDVARLEDRVDASLAAVHSEIVQVALAVGARPKRAGG